jgi:hypothetical protein
LLAAKAYDRAAYYVRGQAAITNLGIASAREDLRTRPNPYSPALKCSLDAAIAQLNAIGAAGGGAKIGMQHRQPCRVAVGDKGDGAGDAGGDDGSASPAAPVGLYELPGMAQRIYAGMMAGAGLPSQSLLKAMAEAVEATEALDGGDADDKEEKQKQQQQQEEKKRRGRSWPPAIGTATCSSPHSVIHVLILIAARAR